jgi:predicted NAD/FAD-binding protein
MIEGKETFKYPIFTKNTLKYQERFTDIQGHNYCFYTVSYFKKGSLEDCISSAISICSKIGVKIPWSKED